MYYDNLIVEQNDSIMTVKISRPNALNALNTDLLCEIKTLIDNIENSSDVKVVIITGDGKAFVAGADISEMKNKDSEEGRVFSQLGNEIFRRIELLDKPVICAVNGFALGGGCELAMACDIRIASEKAKFGQPEVGLGIIPGFGGTQRMPRLIGAARAKELIFTGKIIDSHEAEKIGLVNLVVEQDELMLKAIEVAKDIVKKSSIAVGYSKSAINRGIETDIETGLLTEQNIFGLCFAHDDQKEGMEAFLGKRSAEFK